jgi:hypothetical protein
LVAVPGVVPMPGLVLLVVFVRLGPGRIFHQVKTHFIFAFIVLESRDFSRYIEWREPGQVSTIYPLHDSCTEEIG